MSASSAHAIPAQRRRPRNRATTACAACRARRTRCDNQRPSCGFCRRLGLACEYEAAPLPTPSNVEVQLSAINARLDRIAARLPPLPDLQFDHGPPSPSVPSPSYIISDEEKSPFQLLGGDSTMTGLGLEPGFAQSLLRLERETPPMFDGEPPRLRMIPQQQALDALATFSSHVHSWYPILQPGFSEWFLRTISGPLHPSSDSGLALLVAGIGCFLAEDAANGQRVACASASPFIEAAITSLPAMITANCISSVQCLLFIAIYHACALRPCQAYDYLAIASGKVQSMLQTIDFEDNDLREQITRASWAILLFESELRVQLNLVGSGIRERGDDIALPDSRNVWSFDNAYDSPANSTSPQTSASALTSCVSDHTLAYFLAEIAMRRMLNRCNTAIRRVPDETIVYAPAIAMELELQLENWYQYLPSDIRFDSEQDLDFDQLASPHLQPATDKLSNFLRVQYYCCKISIYWPAAYQCIQDGGVTAELSQHCEKLFGAYIQLMPSILMAIRSCLVNRWTLYASIFMTSMAVLRATAVTGIQQACKVDWARLTKCLQSTQTVDQTISRATPSLTMLSTALSRRVAQSLDVDMIGR